MTAISHNDVRDNDHGDGRSDSLSDLGLSSTTPRTSPRPLEHFLTTPGAPLPDLAQLRAFRLGAYAYTRLGADHPAKATLQRDFLSDTALHQQVVRELAPLLRAWREAGIDVLVFKGFYLAEAVYDAPAQRYYTDVDLLIPEAQIAAASRVAREVGWLEPWSAAINANRYSHEALHSAKRYSHEALHLDSPSGLINLDIHQLVIHRYLPWHPTQTRLTDAVWSNAIPFTWHGVALKTLAPEDAFIVGLVLNRAWSTDAWQLRPRDYLDAWYISCRFGLTEDALGSRARDLVCHQTLMRFLRRCDPFRRHLDLYPPTRLQRLYRSLRVSHERRPSSIERYLLLLLLVPQVLIDMLFEVRVVWRCWRRLRRHTVTTIVEHLRALPERPRRPVFGIARGVHWLVGAMQKARLLAPSKATDLRALATFAALRRRGHAAVLVVGRYHRANASGTTAWVELGSEIVPYTRTATGPIRYQAEHRYPAKPPASTS